MRMTMKKITSSVKALLTELLDALVAKLSFLSHSNIFHRCSSLVNGNNDALL